MKSLDPQLITPIYVKLSPDDPLPPDTACHLLTGDGLFLCRNDRFFQSAIRADRPPSELAPQKETLNISFPRLTRELVEMAVGFHDWAFRTRGAESILLLAWNDHKQQVELIAPEQVATSYVNAAMQIWAENVRYTFPYPLADGLFVYGDIHSHCEMAAYSSFTDQTDEAQFNGLHIVVGRLNREPPEWHAEASVDGKRFHVAPDWVMEDYVVRSKQFPASWKGRHQVDYYGNREAIELLQSPPQLGLNKENLA